MSFDQRWSKQGISCLFFFYFLSPIELENVLESSRERERERERERDVELRRKSKRRELEWVYVCGGEKTREKQKRMDEIERKNNIKNKK